MRKTLGESSERAGMPAEMISALIGAGLDVAENAGLVELVEER
jgi:hypothetical protein